MLPKELLDHLEKGDRTMEMLNVPELPAVDYGSVISWDVYNSYREQMMQSQRNSIMGSGTALRAASGLWGRGL